MANWNPIWAHRTLAAAERKLNSGVPLTEDELTTAYHATLVIGRWAQGVIVVFGIGTLLYLARLAVGS